MIMTNNEIYTRARQLMDVFQDGEQKLPIKINFYLQKNRNALLALAQDIEKARLEIAQNYGQLDENGEQFVIPNDKMAEAAKELEDLFNLEQDVMIYKINIDTLPDDLTMTTAQMEAIMFMID
jgi:predicted  nucleic acid-binding Zn-ribbon protein